MAIINSNIDTGYTVFTFTGSDGEVFASVRANLSDPRLVRRAKHISEFFADLAKTAAPRTAEERADYEDKVEQCFCDFFGYDCRADLFGRVAATAVLADGRIFAMHILDTLVQNVAPEIRRLHRSNVDKYAGKYGAQ